jgi:hypothetical protein
MMPDSEARADTRRAEVAGEDAAVLQAAGVRVAEESQAGGVRDAEVLAAAGDRDAAALRTEGQRGISLIWETTQRQVALLVVAAFTIAQLAVVVVILVVMLRGEPTAIVLAVLGGVLGTLASMMTLVIGFYFGRTNHTSSGISRDASR